jgi:xylulokinase
MAFLIGCDIGSQGVKTVLIDESGRLLGVCGSGYGIEFPEPAWAQQPAQAWIEALTQSVRKLLIDTGIPGDQVLSVGIDAQVDGVVPIDNDGAPLHPAIIWMDRRAVQQCESIAGLIDKDEIFEITGLNLDASHVAPKIRWLMDHQPMLSEQTAYYLLPGSYIAYALTGEVAVDASNASSTMLMDVRQRKYSPLMCRIFGIPEEKLAAIRPATDVVGTLLPKMAERLGLSSHTQVVLGSGDEHAACLGAGVVHPGLVCDIAGTAEPVCAASPAVLFDKTGLVETHCHAHPDLWLLENPGFVSGINYRWFCDEFAHFEIQQAVREGKDVFQLLDQAADSVPAGSRGLIMLPCLMGAMTPTWNAAARGVFMGFTLAHGRAHFARSILEASAYAVRDITDRMQSIGLTLSEIRVVGGGARSALWRQIKADVTGLPVTCLQTAETTALGAAILALAGSGLCRSVDEAVQCVVQVSEIVYPQFSTQQAYEEYYQLYRSTYAAMVPIFEQASRLEVQKP